MTSGSVSCGRYIVGVTYSRPLLRPRWCTRTSGAPSKVPPTLPSFARNSSMVFAFQSLMSDSYAFRRSLGSDAFCVPEMRGEEPSGSVQRHGRLVEDRVIGLEDVRDPGGDVEGGLDVGGGSHADEADRVVEKDLVRSRLDDQGRQV